MIKLSVLDEIAATNLPTLDFMSKENKIINKAQITDFKYWIG